jgi:hypothetical protein
LPLPDLNAGELRHKLSLNELEFYGIGGRLTFPTGRDIAHVDELLFRLLPAGCRLIHLVPILEDYLIDHAPGTVDRPERPMFRQGMPGRERKVFGNLQILG